MQIVELDMNMMIDGNAHLINPLDGSVNHLLDNKHSYLV